MHFTGQLHRPHIEIMSPFLEVTKGCSYNQCNFCTMYQNVSYEILDDDTIIENLLLLRQEHKSPIKRLLLLNGDPVALPMKELVRIRTLIGHYLPEVNTITCYASISNLREKSLEDLKALKDIGFSEFHIGLETAYDPALAFMNKDYNSMDIKEALEKISQAGIEYHAIVIAGIGGAGTYVENTRATTALLNQYPPVTLSAYPLIVREGSRLAQLRDQGEFIEASQREKIQGQLLLLKEAQLPDTCFYTGNLVYNLITTTTFFKDRAKLIREFEDYLRDADPKILEQP